VTKVPKKVQFYEQRFETLKRCGQRFEEFMEALNIIKAMKSSEVRSVQPGDID
jgi:hypothetical protein